MPYPILSDMAASISELKANPMKVVASGDGRAIAILNRNEPVFYCVPAAAYEALMAALGDVDLADLVKSRVREDPVPGSLGDL